MKVLYAASEAYPFAMSGGLADVAGALPKALRRRLVGCRVVMPLYECVNEEMRKNMTFITSFTVPVSWRRQYCGVFEAKVGGVIYYLLDNQYYFKRNPIYGHFDDAERFAFFSRAILELIPHIDFKPDIIHCNDWQTALVPVYLNLFYRQDPRYADIKTVYTIHNIAYQGKYGRELMGDVLGISDEHADMLDYDGCVNFMKAAFVSCDKITTVSPTYAKEIKHAFFAHGLDRILNTLGDKVQGIVNGIDTEVYNPETDDMIFANFTADNPENKAINKQKLQELLGLPVREDVPVVAIVSRLVEHKGFDLVKHIFEEVVANNDVQFAVLGSGEWTYETFFHEMAQKYPHKVGLRLGFVPHLAHKIYAGADIFLMPSKSEPCGLAQMVALRYGTIPLVRTTGGLNDTITDSGDGNGNGFTFSLYNAHDLKDSLLRALDGYKNKEGWQILKKRAMECDNSWNVSAGTYIKLYKELLAK